MQETQHKSPTVSVYSVPQQRSQEGLNRDVMKPHSYPSWKDQQCWRCGRSSHVAADCKFKTAKCHRCGLKGHIERKCQMDHDGKLQQSEIQREQRVHQVDTLADDMVDYFDEAACICTITEQQTTVVKKMDGQRCIVSPFTRDVTVYGERIGMEVDSGSGVTVLNSATFDALKKRQPSLSLSKPEIDLQTYTGSRIKVMGQIILPVSYRGNLKYLQSYVVGGQGQNLLGRSWMVELGISLLQVNAVQGNNAPTSKDMRTISFEPCLGTCKGPPNVDAEKTAAQTTCKPYETSSFAPGGVCVFAEIHKTRKKSNRHRGESLFSTFSRSSSCTKGMYRAVT